MFDTVPENSHAELRITTASLVGYEMYDQGIYSVDEGKKQLMLGKDHADVMSRVPATECPAKQSIVLVAVKFAADLVTDQADENTANDAERHCGRHGDSPRGDAEDRPDLRSGDRASDEPHTSTYGLFLPRFAHSGSMRTRLQLWSTTTNAPDDKSASFCLRAAMTETSR